MADKTVSVTLRARADQYIAEMKRAAAASTQMATGTQRSLTQMGTGMQSAGRTMSTAVTLPLVAAGAGAVKLAVDFQGAFSRMVGLAQVPAGEIDKLRESVLSLAGETGQAPVALADALYEAASAGLTSAQAMSAVELAAKGAASGMGSAQDIVGLVASATASYGAANISAAETVDILTQTIREGRADPEELAGSLGRILPIAAQMGVSFAEVGGIVAYTTNAFGDTDRAVTGVNDALAKLSAPTDSARAVMLAMGSSVEELHAAIRSDGLLGGLELLREKGFAGNAAAIRELMPDMQGAATLTLLLNDAAGTLTSTLESTAASTGALESAWDAAQTDGLKLKQAWVEIQIAMIEAGEIILPVLASVMGGIADLAEAFAKLPEPVQTAILALGGVAALVGPMLIAAGSIAKSLDLITAAYIRMAAAKAAGVGGGFIGPVLPGAGRVGPGAAGRVPIGGPALLAALVANQVMNGAARPRSALPGDTSEQRRERDGQGVLYDRFTRPSGTSSLGAPSGSFASRMPGESWTPTQPRGMPGAPMAGPTPGGGQLGAWAEQAAAIRKAEVSAEAGAAAVDRLAYANRRFTMDTSRAIEVAAEQYAQFQQNKAITEGYAAAVASSDWGNAAFAGATSAMSAYTQQFFGMANIAMATETAYDTLGESIKENGLNFDLATEAGRENQQALQGLAGTLDSQFVSAFDNANGSFDTFMQSADAIGMNVIGRLMTDFGLTADEATNLATQMGLTAKDYEARFNLSGDEEAKIRLGLLGSTIGLLQDDVQREVAMKIATGDFQGALDLVQANIAETPLQRLVRLEAIDNVSGTVNRIQRLVNSLTGKSITLTTNTVNNQTTYRRSVDYGTRNPVTGGAMRATAMGGYFGSADVRLIGEAGPEVVLPLSRPSRMRDLLSDPRVFGPMSALASGATSKGDMSFDVKVFVGDREITDIVRTEFRQRDRQAAAGSRF